MKGFELHGFGATGTGLRGLEATGTGLRDFGATGAEPHNFAGVDQGIEVKWVDSNGCALGSRDSRGLVVEEEWRTFAALPNVAASLWSFEPLK